MDAANNLEKIGISCEVIDTQTLVPFDISHDIIDSVKKTKIFLNGLKKIQKIYLKKNQAH